MQLLGRKPPGSELARKLRIGGDYGLVLFLSSRTYLKAMKGGRGGLT